MTKVFPSSIHIQTPNLDTKVLRWAWSIGLFEEHAELERCRIQKVNWFAGYMFPAETPERLELIMRFFLCLFLLDDLLDNYLGSDSMDYLTGLRKKNPQSDIPRLNALGFTLVLTHQSLRYSGPSGIWQREWEEAWGHYISGLQWEVENKTNNQMPKLEDYRIHRPSGSGVYLAIHLLRTASHPDLCEADLLENDIARFICLSNDLVSFEKEFLIGDFHNELIILQQSLGNEVRAWAVRETRVVQNRILGLGEQVAARSETCKQWVENLFLLVGGCLAWSGETSRYVAYVNGTLKSN